MPAPSAALARPAKILLVEDDPATVLLLKDMLEADGYRLWCAGGASEAKRVVTEVRPDLVILDLMLPDANGLVLCADLKAELGVPVILCSATQRRDDSVLGFKLGADDFVAKPFSVDDLKVRVAMALRRAGHAQAPPGPASPPPPSIGNLVLDYALCRARLGDHVLPLTPTEYHLLCALAERPGVVVARQELTKRVWGYDDRGVRHSLEVHVQRLRAKLGVGGPQAPQLLTQRGFGYCLVPPGRSATAWPARGSSQAGSG
jgi:DNA-binding response OmpR family regulator